MSDYDPNYVDVKHFYRIGVKIAIVNHKNEVLVLRRSQLSPLPGVLDLPGGGVDAHESPETAIIRETIEETGISIADVKITGSGLSEHTEDSWIMLGFGARVDNPEVVLSWEHDEYHWIPLDQVDSTELPNGYKQIVHSFEV
jgi:8-oxo-dGTP diphosphatase